MSHHDYLDTHTLIVGASGAGKTVTAKHQVEQMLEARRHVCIVDPTGVWFGLRTAADGISPGYPIPIFGGANGDVPITPEQGATVGEIVAASTSAIVDLSAMDSDEQQEFVHAMIAALRKKPRGNFHLVVDEADEFAPQTSPSKAGEAAKRQMEWIAKRGRVQGFVLTAITQRPADIAKSVISQMQTVIAHQLVSPIDQDAVRAYLKANANKETISAVMESLAGLARGERWIYSPRLGILERGTSDVPRTFDSSRTPEPGEQPIEPKMLASIDIEAIRKALAVEEYPRANSPVRDDSGEFVKLQERIKRLETEIADIVRERDAHRSRCFDADRLIDTIREAILDYSPGCSQTATAVHEQPNAGGNDVDGSAGRAPTKPEQTQVRRRVDREGAKNSSDYNRRTNGAGFAPRWHRILDATAWATRLLKRDSVERNIVAWLAETSPKSSGYANDLGAMRTAGLIEYPAPGMVALGRVLL